MDGLGAAEQVPVVKVQSKQLDNLLGLRTCVRRTDQGTPGLALDPERIAFQATLDPLVQPGFGATQRGTNAFGLLSVKKTLYGPGPLLLNVIHHEHLHFGFGAHDCDRVAIRLSESVVHDVLALYFVYDVMAFNS